MGYDFSNLDLLSMHQPKELEQETELCLLLIRFLLEKLLELRVGIFARKGANKISNAKVSPLLDLELQTQIPAF